MSDKPSKCSICALRYDSESLCPRMLMCGHTFCSECLGKLATNNQVVCPIDRKISAVPAGNFPKNFLVLDLLAVDQKPSEISWCALCEGEKHPATHQCLECEDFMCSVAASIHLKAKVSKAHQVKTLDEVKANPQLSQTVSGLEHSKAFEYFDKQCGRLVCVSCVVLSHRATSAPLSLKLRRSVVSRCSLWSPKATVSSLI